MAAHSISEPRLRRDPVYYVLGETDSGRHLFCVVIEFPGGKGYPVTAREMTLKALAETIIRMTGSTSRLVYKPLPEDDPKVRQPDITRAKTLLGWEPKVGLEEGLKETIEYFRTKV